MPEWKESMDKGRLQERLKAFLDALPESLKNDIAFGVPLSPFTTLRVGGKADMYYLARERGTLARIVEIAQALDIPYFLLGGGSNICISDSGVRGLTIHNGCRSVDLGEITRCDTGYSLMQLFLNTAKNNLSGLEFAVGIPGTLGGALVSNAGAYRDNIGHLITDLEVVEGGVCKTVPVEWMEFSYRDSKLRRGLSPQPVVVSARLQLTPGNHSAIFERARENQRQRIFKQPWYPSAGSFFKNVNDPELAQSLPNLPVPLKMAGVVPAGYLNAACGCKGLRVGDAQVSQRHANFIVNRGRATARDIRLLADIVKRRVREQFGVELQEEVLYVGDPPDPQNEADQTE
jgi:UDP-N-acetylmuramate dehydrogenase